MSERKMAEGRIEIPRPDGTAVTVELKARGVVIGEWNRPGEEGTCSGYTLSREWPGTKTDFALAEELLCVVHERDVASRRAELAEAALADAVKEAAYHAARAYDGETLADRNAYIGEDLTEQRDALGKALLAAVTAAAEGGLILEALRLAATDELSPQIMRAIEPALAQIHAAMESLGALRAAGLLEEDS